MRIDDTFIVTQSVGLVPASDTSPDDFAKATTQMINDLARRACHDVGKQKPEHRTFALSVTSSVIEHGDERFLFVTTIVALVRKESGDIFPWAKPDWIPRSTN